MSFFCHSKHFITITFMKSVYSFVPSAHEFFYQFSKSSESYLYFLYHCQITVNPTKIFLSNNSYMTQNSSL